MAANENQIAVHRQDEETARRSGRLQIRCATRRHFTKARQIVFRGKRSWECGD